jgi:hypothetical protein
MSSFLFMKVFCLVMGYNVSVPCTIFRYLLKWIDSLPMRFKRIDYCQLLNI